MNFLLILLPFVVFATSRVDSLYFSDFTETQHAVQLSLAVSRIVERKSTENLADYLSDGFLYSHCDMELGKEEILRQLFPLIFKVESAFRSGPDFLIISASSIKKFPMVVRAQKNDTLIGGYQIQEMFVQCDRMVAHQFE